MCKGGFSVPGGQLGVTERASRNLLLDRSSEWNFQKGFGGQGKLRTDREGDEQ